MNDDAMNNTSRFSDDKNTPFANSDIKAPSSLLPRLMQRLQVEQQNEQTLDDITSLHIALDSTDEFVRATAIRELALWQGNIADIPANRLLATLSDASWLVREAAILTLDALDITVSQEQQMMVLLDENEFVREAARITFVDGISKDGTEDVWDSRYSRHSRHSRATARVAPTIQRRGRSHLYQTLHSIDSLFLAIHVTDKRGLFMAGQYPHNNNNTYLEEITIEQNKRRRKTLGVAGAILAVLVIAGIAFSWSTVLQKMPHNATTGHGSPTLDGPILSDTNQVLNPQLYWVDNTHLVLGDPNNQSFVNIWDIQTKAMYQATPFNLISQQQSPQSQNWQKSPNGMYTVASSVAVGAPPTSASSPRGYTVSINIWNLLANHEVTAISYEERVGPPNPNLDYLPPTPATSFSPDNTRLAIGQNDGKITIWSLSTGKQLASYQTTSTLVSFVQWSNDSRRLLSQVDNGNVDLWDTTTGKRISSFLPPLTQQIIYTSSGQTSKNVPTTPTLSPDGKLMVGEVGTDTIEVWDANTIKVLYTRKQASHSLSYASWISDNRVFIGTTSNVQVWDLNTSSIILNVPTLSQAGSAFSPSLRYLTIISPSSQNVTLWDTSTGQQVTILHSKAYFQINGEFPSIVWSPDERYVATLSKDTVHKSLSNVIQIWNATTGKLVTQYHSNSNQVLQIVWSSDGKYLASVSDGNFGNVMEVWNAPR